LASPRDSSSAAGWNPRLRFDDVLPGMALDMRRSKNSKLGVPVRTLVSFEGH
jgi:hypothetical protein